MDGGLVKARLRALVKRTLEEALLAGGVARRGRSGLREGVVVLAYHNVLPEGTAQAGEHTLHLPVEAFRAHLDLLRRTHEVVGLETLAEPRGAAERPRAVITFDDAYRGAVNVGLPECARRGLPATVFVTPGILGAGALWWDRLADPATGEMAAGRRDVLLDGMAGLDGRVVQHARDSGWPLHALDPAFGIASVEELDRAAALPGVTLGAHTWSHPNLTRLDAETLREELERPLAWLRERYDNATPWLAHPYGLTNAEVDRAARDAGYAGSFRIEGGAIRGAVEAGERALPRVNVPAGVSLAGLELRMAGFRRD